MSQRTCLQCGSAFGARRRDAKYCSRRCGAKAHRDNHNKVCATPDCGRPVRAKGLCAYHYREMRGRLRQDEYYDVTCIVCTTGFRSSRTTGKFCSDACKGKHYAANGIGRRRIKSPLPSDHPVILLIAANKRAEREQFAVLNKERARLRSLSTFEWRTERECPGCACRFSPLYTSNMTTCSKRCQRRVTRWRRNAAERKAPGSFTWSEFMRIARRFDYLCAYCGERDGQLDPDHVVPLSRGGINSTTNLLPACRQCNGDKRDLLLHEWEADRHARGKPPRATSWAPEDKRYWHLTQALLTPVA